MPARFRRAATASAARLAVSPDRSPQVDIDVVVRVDQPSTGGTRTARTEKAGRRCPPSLQSSSAWRTTCIFSAPRTPINHRFGTAQTWRARPQRAIVRSWMGKRGHGACLETAEPPRASLSPKGSSNPDIPGTERGSWGGPRVCGAGAMPNMLPRRGAETRSALQAISLSPDRTSRPEITQPTTLLVLVAGKDDDRICGGIAESGWALPHLIAADVRVNRAADCLVGSDVDIGVHQSRNVRTRTDRVKRRISLMVPRPAEKS